MANTMIHWNGNQLCAVDTETTGLDYMKDVMVQICILPLDSNIVPRQDVSPFYLLLKPTVAMDRKAVKVHGLKVEDLEAHGIEADTAIDMLLEWIKTLDLTETKWGTPKKIIPLGHNYAFDRNFIAKWLGHDLYNTLFHYHYRDTMNTAAYLNDRAAMHANKVPYNKLSLQWVASSHDLKHNTAHDALNDCLTTAEVYRRQLQQGVLG